ncbi:glycosyltransferase [Flavobacterium sp. DG2-3]|uniref:glycosyltransferase n=1 Tax=Flavobacterium sp. DG2-3 TaxID=3068317 RepID=UPI00273FC5A6|nr:glycosyltransferase [Flavobacterium sp. DG2-3]MDP5200710.1 glycosyltransferase [Flavobacterium sp. DG2-3]
MNISVCMASYNGAEFIEEQLRSILNQLDDTDELIIVDDCSKDDTIEKIKIINDSRISVFKNETNKGHVFTFGRAISLTNNDIIFMSDQDDIWLEDRVYIMKKELTDNGSLLVSSNTNFINSRGEVLDYKMQGVKSQNSKKNLKNIIDIYLGKENYYGCAMAFKKELKQLILPIPSYVESHDLWIAKAANLINSNTHCDKITLSRRVHGNNASIIKRPFLIKLWARIIFTRSIFQLIYRSFK